MVQARKQGALHRPGQVIPDLGWSGQPGWFGPGSQTRPWFSFSPPPLGHTRLCGCVLELIELLYDVFKFKNFIFLNQFIIF
jgi:hypothetical protein